MNEQYIIDGQLMKRILKTLEDHWFESAGEEQYNNDDVISLSGELAALLPMGNLPTEGDSHDCEAPRG